MFTKENLKEHAENFWEGECDECYFPIFWSDKSSEKMNKAGDNWQRGDRRSLETFLLDTLIEHSGKFTSNGTFEYPTLNLLKRVVSAFEPSIAVDDPKQVAIWPSLDAMAEGEKKRMRGKPGRMFRRIFPMLSDAQLEILVDAFRLKFSARTYKVHNSIEPDDFVKAYTTKHGEYENPYTTSDRKSLANSCMRYEFDHLTHHPVYAYGSGDFRIFWAEDNSGCLGARMIVAEKIQGKDREVVVCGPVYGICEKSMTLVLSDAQQFYAAQGREMQSTNYRSDDTMWIGSRLLLIKYRNNDGEFIAPYLDPEPRRCTVKGDYLVVSHNGEVEMSGYQGTQASGPMCESCEDSCGGNYCTTADGIVICQDCYEHHYFNCEHCEEISHNSVRETVETDIGYDTLCEYCCTNHAVHSDSVDNYIYFDDAIFVESEDVYIPVWNTRGYFQSDLTGEYHPECDRVVVNVGKNREFWSESEARDEPGYVENQETGEWEKEEENTNVA